MTRRRGALALAASVAAPTLIAPSPAAAHGLAGRTDLPLPGWIFAWAAGVVLVVSFVGLSVLWRRPRLEEAPGRPVARIPRAAEPVAGALGIAAFAGLVYAGLAGSQEPLANLLPTFVFVVFWVGLPVLSVLVGDVFAPLSPWRATARGVAWLAARAGVARRRAPLRYPAWLGRRPAALGLLGFAWVELVYPGRDDPSTLAWLAIAYALTQLMGMALFGIATWSARADPFGVYFGIAGRTAPLEARAGELRVRPPLAGLTTLDPVPGTVAVVCVLIGTTSFDGAATGLWAQVGPSVTRFFADLGAGPDAAAELAGTLGLLVAVLAVTGAYLLGVRGMSGAVRRRVAPATFAHTMAPIALAYVVAHYFSLLVFQGQAMAALLSDPLGDGSDLLGTGHWTIHYNVLSSSAIWYVQVGALIAGHVGGLILAHDRALSRFPPRLATRSQHWMLAIMVGFTSLGLWLLSTVSSSS